MCHHIKACMFIIILGSCIMASHHLYTYTTVHLGLLQIPHCLSHTHATTCHCIFRYLFTFTTCCMHQYITNNHTLNCVVNLIPGLCMSKEKKIKLCSSLLGCVCPRCHCKIPKVELFKLPKSSSIISQTGLCKL